MELINTIINELIDAEKSLSNPLLKTAFLAHKIKNVQLSEWVNSELKGYNDETTLPSYRKIKANIRGTFINANIKYTNQPVPLSGFDPEMEQQLRQLNFFQSITTLEQMKENSSKTILAHPFSAEMVGIIGKNWIEYGNPYLQLISCEKYIDGTASNEIVARVRASLLEFMFKIDTEFGGLTEIEDLQKNGKEIKQIMSQTIITTTGDGNVINTGNNVTQHNQISIGVKNKKELSEYLEGIGVVEEDRSELLTIVDAEVPDQSTGSFGNRVNQWIAKMVTKALEGTWKVAKETAVSVLSDAVKKYYGID
jgi:hypothetical protein